MALIDPPLQSDHQELENSNSYKQRLILETIAQSVNSGAEDHNSALMLATNSVQREFETSTSI